ncbi:hypothetical protein [Xenophilus sp. Marseille-Q4582]|uniref:portal protein n=1 Tax=Xenophilus sp. Marseille-Q4582 TaxID=2866600 RepID=UPI001CE4AE57|nr:hypothetical protein [Xenophilus sp. Marseille-Q4582]
MARQDTDAERQEPADDLRAQLRTTLIDKRSEAISARQSSGIESDWEEDEEHYQGIDDANRKFQAAFRTRSTKNFFEARERDTGARSVLFLNITRPYVDAAAARVADMLLPTDDRAWEIKPTPLPELDSTIVQALGGPEAAADVLEQTIEQAKAAAAGMQEEIDDCLVEANWHGEVRKMIEDAARLGSGVLKGPYPVKRSGKLVKRDAMGVVQQINISEIKPGSRRIDPWNFFPDGACGEDIHQGSGTWEREYLSRRQLLEMAAMPGYDREQVLLALKEGPSSMGAREAQDGAVQRHEDQWAMWIFHGYCDAEQMRAVGVKDMEEVTDEKVPAMAVLINDRLVKVTLSALDSGDFPYDVLAWQTRPGLPWGMGISRQMRNVQRMLNGAVRNMMDNAALSSAPQIVIGNGVTPADGAADLSLRRGRVWRLDPSSDASDVRAAFNAFVVPSVQNELMNIVEFALRMAEDTTGMPAMLQGIRGDAPKTLGGMQMQNNNASSVLRRLAKRFDDYITRPHIRRYYDWMMQHSDKDEIKGDMEIDVRASSALVERDAQQQFLLGLVNVVGDPRYEVHPGRFMGELLKGQRIDPKRIQYTAEEKAQQSQQQPDPLNEAKAAVETARVDLIAAQTAETQAKTATKNVEGMFSATQAAANVAMSPGIAPAADAMWMAGGGTDQTPQDPAIPNVDVPDALPPETNTNPLTPANPATGMNTGIEGGQP